MTAFLQGVRKLGPLPPPCTSTSTHPPFFWVLLPSLTGTDHEQLLLNFWRVFLFFLVNVFQNTVYQGYAKYSGFFLNCCKWEEFLSSVIDNNNRKWKVEKMNIKHMHTLDLFLLVKQECSYDTLLFGEQFGEPLFCQWPQASMKGLLPKLKLASGETQVSVEHFSSPLCLAGFLFVCLF